MRQALSRGNALALTAALRSEMSLEYDKKLISLAKALRKNMTDEEKHLWYDFFKKLPVTVNRQKVIGDYIVDFFVAEQRIAIEVDGTQHGDPEQREKDKKRDFELRSLGIRVLRYTNKDVCQRFENVCEDILRHLQLR